MKSILFRFLYITTLFLTFNNCAAMLEHEFQMSNLENLIESLEKTKEGLGFVFFSKDDEKKSDFLRVFVVNLEKNIEKLKEFQSRFDCLGEKQIIVSETFIKEFNNLKNVLEPINILLSIIPDFGKHY